jgi:hypothetical protein
LPLGCCCADARAGPRPSLPGTRGIRAYGGLARRAGGYGHVVAPLAAEEGSGGERDPSDGTEHDGQGGIEQGGSLRPLLSSATIWRTVAGVAIERRRPLQGGVKDLVLTETADRYHGYYGGAEDQRAVAALIPAGRMAVPDDITDACLLLASPLAGCVSGAELRGRWRRRSARPGRGGAVRTGGPAGVPWATSPLTVGCLSLARRAPPTRRRG